MNFTAEQGEQVNPAVLVWARESAGLDLSAAVKQLAFSASKGETGEQKLLELESGARLPTRTQLIKIAKAYRRPLLAFYMEAPPRPAPRGEDFRSTGAAVSPRDNALLDALLRDVKARQEMVRSLLEDLDEAATRPYVASFALPDGPEELARRISADLRLSPQLSERGGTVEEFFKKLRSAAEAMGVFVLLAGDLGSHHTELSEQVFRGFALADPVAPFIVINDKDAKPARPFTLVHELAHIYLGQSGVSGTPERLDEKTQKGRVEQFCNDVAGLVLLPPDFAKQLSTQFAGGGKEPAARYIEAAGRAWRVSEPLVALRLRRLGWISEAVYRNLSENYAERWALSRKAEKAANKDKPGGPDFYTVRQDRLGTALIDVVRRTLREDRLTHSKAAKVLGMKLSSVEPLLHRYEQGLASFAREAAR